MISSHISKNHEAHNEIRRASEFFQYKIPNYCTCVGKLLKSLTSKDVIIVAVMAHILRVDAQR